MEIEYRHPTEADAQDIADVMNLSGREMKHHTDTTADIVRVWTFGDKDFDPAGHLLGFADGRAVAFAATIVDSDSIEAGQNNAYMGISVVPEFRGRGIEEHLLDFVACFLRSKHVAALRLVMTKEFTWKVDIAQKAGMKDLRHHYQMKCVQKEHMDRPPVPKGYTIQTIVWTEASDGDVKNLADVVNDAFSESWSYYPVTADIYKKSRDEEKRTGVTESMLLFAKERKKIVGVCMAEIYNDYNLQHDEKAGFSMCLGVRETHRRAGLGRILLANSMAWLTEKGMDTLYLGVDAENDTALGLYKSLGYAIDKEGIVYELKL